MRQRLLMTVAVLMLLGVMPTTAAGLFSGRFMMTEQTEQDFRALWEAVATGRLEVVEEALSSGVDPNVREPNGSTL